MIQGVIELLDRSGVEISGKKAVVVGRSNIVGMPVAMLLTNRDATVTVLHSKTPNAQELCSTADIVVAAIGKPELVKGDWIKEGAAVIDVGTNAVDVGLFTFPHICSYCVPYERLRASVNTERHAHEAFQSTCERASIQDRSRACLACQGWCI